ncbi:unnamed protein product [Meganyctiphanes norvegica]|uniref:Uncharacterized protein n=1 Tax=Meganyctiphanes norvegica TaxID=48144 RepID=A0AAV2S619_MEGNR
MFVLNMSPHSIARMSLLLALMVQLNTACPSKPKAAPPPVVKKVQAPEPQQEVVEEVVQVASRGRQHAAPPHVAPAPSASPCSISMMMGTADAAHMSLMQQLCQQGRKNILVKGLIDDVPANEEAQRRAEQFMILNLHRDAFATTPTYYNGVAPDNLKKYWKVDDTVQLSNGNMWYRNALPLWPLLNQSMKPKKKSIVGTGGTPDWPNYAIGTPMYLIGNDVANFRDPKVSVSKFFAGELASTPQFAQSACTGTCKIVDPTKLKAGINTFIMEKFTDSNNNYKADAASVNAYSNWAELLVQESLPLMLKSFNKRQKSRCPKTQCSLCPDELLLFMNQKPCPALKPCPILDGIKQQLTLAGCDTTEMVVGHLAATAG